MARPGRRPPAYLFKPSAHLYHPPQCLRARQFCSTPAVLAMQPGRAERMQRRMVESQKAMQQDDKHIASPKTLMRKEQDKLTSETLPRDLGFLAGTLIVPPKEKLSPLATAEGLQERKTLLIEYLKTTLGNWYSLYHYRNKLYPQPRRQRPVLFKPRLAPLAKALYASVYAALARGTPADRDFLSARCCEGLADDFARRMSRREHDAGARMDWRIVKWLERPSVVSHRAAPWGFKVEGAEVGVRQAVVRCVTVQRVRVGRAVKAMAPPPPGKERESGEEQRQEEDGEERVKWSQDVTKTVKEYMVLQRRQILGKESDWEVWGFVDETPIEDIMGLSEEEKEQRRKMAASREPEEKGELSGPTGTGTV